MNRSNLLLVLFAALILSLAGCRESTPPTHSHAASPEAPLPDRSLYHLPGDWEDQDGERTFLADLRGKVQMVAMIYTTCKGACPRIVADMKSLREEVEESHPGGIGFLLVTMDPETDTPARLRQFAQEQELGPEWRLLRGTDGQTREIAAVLNAKYRKLEGGNDFAHSNLITILDRDGVIVHQQEGLGVPVEGGVEVLEDLLSEPAPCCQ